MVFVTTLSIAMNHPLLHAMCRLFVSLCDSFQTYSVIVPTEAVTEQVKGSNEACGHWKN